TAGLPERGMVGSGRQRVSTAGGACAAGLPERRLVGSGRQCVQAAAGAVPAELRGRPILESGFQRLSAAWPGLSGGTDAGRRMIFSTASAWMILVYSTGQRR